MNEAVTQKKIGAKSGRPDVLPFLGNTVNKAAKYFFLSFSSTNELKSVVISLCKIFLGEN